MIIIIIIIIIKGLYVKLGHFYRMETTVCSKALYHYQIKYTALVIQYQESLFLNRIYNFN